MLFGKWNAFKVSEVELDDLGLHLLLLFHLPGRWFCGSSYGPGQTHSLPQGTESSFGYIPWTTGTQPLPLLLQQYFLHP